MSERANNWDELLAKPPFKILLHAHDHTWRDGGWSLICRVRSTDAIWRAIIEEHRAPKKKEKKPYSKPKLTHYGNLRTDTQGSIRGKHHDSHHGRLHKTA